MEIDRRWFFAGGAALLAAGAWGLIRARPTRFAFDWMERPEGFRRARWDGRVSTAAFDPLIGLDGAGDGRSPFEGDLCAALFGGPPGPGVDPVASFSDPFCPYCRVLVPALAEIERASGGAVRVRWHEWPLFGARSMASARLAIAAEAQGAYGRVAPRLMGSGFLVTPGYARALAESAGIDAERLIADMASPGTTARIARSVALATLFGFIGTPALVVGRSVVEGAIPRDALEELIAIEAELPPPAVCRADV